MTDTQYCHDLCAFCINKTFFNNDRVFSEQEILLLLLQVAQYCQEETTYNQMKMACLADYSI
jgi:hypothetical protein